MRIVIVTYGSLGDLHPAIALALGLQARGHDAAIATSEPYREKIAALGLPFLAVRPNIAPGDESLVRRLMDGMRGSKFLMRGLMFPAVRDMHADLAPIAARADLLVTSELACAAPIVAQLQRVRWAFFSLSPISFFPVADPPLLPGPPGSHAIQSMGPLANRLFFAVAKAVSYSWWRPVRRLRRELGLPAGSSPMFEGKFSPQLNLALFSRMLQLPQPDWPANTVQTGFLFHNEDGAPGAATAAGRHRADTTGGGHGPGLPEAVETFLAAGDPPIVFTLGSAAVLLARDFYVHSALAAQALERRALLLLGNNPPPPNLPPSILAWDYLPFAAIFPRAAAIVHQGGVGTIAQALRAGRPMLVMPFAHDQFDNAARVTRLGIARRIGRSRYNATTAARELAALLGDARARVKASLIGEEIRAERGLEHACDAIERLLG